MKKTSDDLQVLIFVGIVWIINLIVTIYDLCECYIEAISQQPNTLHF
jgi:hypothetical protein